MRNLLLLEAVITLAALVTGTFVLLLALALARVVRWPVSYALIAGAASTLFSWLVWSSRAANILEHMHIPERRKPPTQDLTPKHATVDLRIHAERPGGYLEGTFLDRLPVAESALVELARRALEGQSLTTSQMTAGGLSRADWETLRDRLIGAGLLSWRFGSRAHGCQTTSKGRAVFSRMASPTPPPDRTSL